MVRGTSIKLLILLGGLFYAQAAAPGILVVSSAADSGPGTLRDAIMLANVTPGQDEIEISAGLATAVLLQGPLPTLTEGVTIAGDAADPPIIDGAGRYRILMLAAASSVDDYELSNLILRYGSSEAGAAIMVERAGQVVLRNLALIDNTASSLGGALAVSSGLAGNVLVENSLLEGNQAGRGGAISATQCGTVMIVRNSRLVGNAATDPDFGQGGAIYGCASFALESSELSGNQAVQGGAAIGLSLSAEPLISIVNTTISSNIGGGIMMNYRGGPTLGPRVLLNHVTLTANAATAAPASIESKDQGIYRQPGFNELELVMNNTIIANNQSDNCSSPVVDAGSYNLDADGSCGLSMTANVVLRDPLLGDLGDHGGSTLTHVPDSASPAIDSADPAGCPAADQRGFPRPNDGDADGIARCDIGAVERSDIIAYHGFEDL